MGRSPRRVTSTPPKGRLPTAKQTSSNFGFLRVHDPLLEHLGALAERYFTDDPSTALLKLRQFGEVLAQRTTVSRVR